jgi:hypothetical protein
LHTAAGAQAHGGGAPLPKAQDTTAPRISRLRVVPSEFKAKKGARVRYRLSEDAHVSFIFRRGRPGRRSGKKCVKTTPRNRRARHCTRYPPYFVFFARHGVAGANSLLMRDRVGGRRLRPSPYRLTLGALDAEGNNSTAARSSFRVLAP